MSPWTIPIIIMLGPLWLWLSHIIKHYAILNSAHIVNKYSMLWRVKEVGKTWVFFRSKGICRPTSQWLPKLSSPLWNIHYNLSCTALTCKESYENKHTAQVYESMFPYDLSCWGRRQNFCQTTEITCMGSLDFIYHMPIISPWGSIIPTNVLSAFNGVRKNLEH